MIKRVTAALERRRQQAESRAAEYDEWIKKIGQRDRLGALLRPAIPPKDIS